MRFERQLAVRYLRSRRRYGFVSVIPLLSCLGIAVGVMAMLVTLSVMDGFEEDLKEKLLGNMAPVTLTRKHMNQDHLQELRERLAGLEEVRGLSPYVRTQVLVLSVGRPVGGEPLGPPFRRGRRRGGGEPGVDEVGRGERDLREDVLGRDARTAGVVGLDRERRELPLERRRQPSAPPRTSRAPPACPARP